MKTRSRLVALLVMVVVLAGCDGGQQALTYDQEVAATGAAIADQPFNPKTVDEVFFEFTETCMPVRDDVVGTDEFHDMQCARSQMRWPVNRVLSDRSIQFRLDHLPSLPGKTYRDGTFGLGYSLMQVAGDAECRWGATWLDGYERDNQVLQNAALLWFETDWMGYEERFKEYFPNDPSIVMGPKDIYRYIRSGDARGLRETQSCTDPDRPPRGHENAVTRRLVPFTASAEMSGAAEVRMQRAGGAWRRATRH